MNALVVLAVVSVVGAAALFVALALFLRAIDAELEAIGGPATRFVTPANYLSKIRLGVRAIERQTDALAPQVGQLNEGARPTARGAKSHRQQSGRVDRSGLQAPTVMPSRPFPTPSI